MINTYNTSHLGTQPIRVLQHNILAQFEKTTPEFLQLTLDTITSKGLKRGIGYFINEYPISHDVYGRKQTPYVDTNKKIHIHETFTSYVWCISYSLVVLYDEAVAKPSQNMFYGAETNIIDHNKIKDAQKLFDYGISLIKVFTPWNKEELPNPEYYKEEDDFYVVRVNGIYVYAMNFILCHEFAHVESEHFERAAKVNNIEAKHILEFEKEADKKAIDYILAGVTDEKRKTAIGGILIGLCCLLFFKSDTLNQTHPDTDKRIDNFLDLVGPNNDDALWGIASLAYKLWDTQFTKLYTYPKQINDYKEMYEIIKQTVENENKVKREKLSRRDYGFF